MVLAPEEIHETAFAALPAAVLDESHLPACAVLVRVTNGRILRGRIEPAGDAWNWHFILDTAAVYRREGRAASYEEARTSLLGALAELHVQVQVRRDAKPRAEADAAGTGRRGNRG
jgi:hypothetical protein